MRFEIPWPGISNVPVFSLRGKNATNARRESFRPNGVGAHFRCAGGINELLPHRWLPADPLRRSTDTSS